MRRKTIAAAVVVVAAVATTTAARRHAETLYPRTLIRPDLRSPLADLASIPYTDRTLPVIRAMFRVPRWSGPGVKVRNCVIDDGLRVRITVPSGLNDRRPAVLWLHAGGMITGSPQFEGPMLGQLARELDAVIVSPDYRLAPEFPFPAAHHDGMAALRWMLSNGDELGIDPSRIAVGGSSAGGGLAAVIAQRCHDEGIRLCAQALLYPMLDDRTALKAQDRGLVWSERSNSYAWQAYLAQRAGADEVPAYAAAARRADLADVAPVWLGVGDCDVLREEALAYAAALQRSGVDCQLAVVPGMFHAADTLLPWAESSRTLHRRLFEFLAEQLRSTT